MPEGHTIHRLARRLGADLLPTAGAHRTLVASSPQGRFVDGAARLEGATVRRAEAFGKHLVVTAEGAEGPLYLHVHLGLFGRFRRRRAGTPLPGGALRLVLGTATPAGPGPYRWELSGPTACELVSAEEIAELAARIGADPLDPAADPTPAYAAVAKSRRAIGALLLDQRLFSGIGNVYRAELLFLVGLDPRTPGRAVPRGTLEALWGHAKVLLARGEREGRIVTTDRGPKAKRAESLYIYRRRRCPRCEGATEEAILAARPIRFCPTCQPAP